ncbi:DUF4870 domain-containing protein [Cellulomonas sp. NS3]|uniref:DUF4870 domain-containing protein n=1 Tax=Cellulomonas sp. NS3 TaxID=2973977 RepID=UPI0021625D79|nr:DUF4870 domain-containing protein [Cellulomonas sp. NS3]
MSDHPPTAHPAAPLTDAETRQWAGLAHLGGILWIIPGLIIWLVFRARSAFVDQEGKKAVNFQITLLLAGVALSVLGGIIDPLWALTQLANFALWVVSIIFSIQGYLAVQRGQAYRYPVSLELIK